MSTTRVKLTTTNFIGLAWIKIGSATGLIHVTEISKEEVEINNLTNLNLTLKLTGPVSERDLTVVLLLEQIVGVCLALFIRYYVADLIY